jgi:hypothetical protein
VSRFVVGIDLGTSNSAVAYADLEEVRASNRTIIRELEIPQLVAPGDVQPRKLLPSALYEPASFEMVSGEALLPWSMANASSRPDVVGEAARRLGAKTPVRLIESAKSWLCHGGVNRTASILPWHAPDDVPKMSPIDASASYLRHIRDAWNHTIAKDDPDLAFERQGIIITVPASFDEIARQLTLEAARRAELPADVTLIEEPLSAFYAFIARTGGTTRTTGLSGGERVLVADVGGGTTDFTLIEVKAKEGDEDGLLEFERTAVGDHLLLGGDNMDLALAHALEGSLAKGKRIDAEAFAQLKLECRLAKETLFSHPEKDALPIVVVGRGSKIIGGSMRTELARDRLLEIVLEGYYPRLPAGEEARPQKSTRAGLTEYGLPYASDPAITRHLAAFLLRHARPGEPLARVDAVLYNGGALKPTIVRDRIGIAIGEWMRASGAPSHPDPRALVYDEGEEVLELAVARGAAYFGLVRAGLGLRVGGGSPREYFLGLGLEANEVLEPSMVKVVCVAPRGMQEGQRIELADREFSLVTNRPVQFPIYATTSPRSDPVGSVVLLSEEEVTKLPPLHTVVKFGKQKAGTEIPVRIQVRRTELDTLELSCLSRMSGARFKLEFELRGEDEAAPIAAEEGQAPAAAFDAPFGGAGVRAPPEAGEVEPERIERAKQRIVETFAEKPPRPDSDQLMKGLESDLGLNRDAFSLPILRMLAELLLELMERRAITPELEARWLNVVGFCLRPGFGVAVDDWRVRQLWKIHAQGVLHPGHDPCELNWWILWRRVAGGLSRGHQEELASVVFPLVIPALAKRAKKKPPRAKSQEAAEMWRAAASLERIGAKSRAQLGEALVEQIEKKGAPKGALWCLGRIGARKLLYGTREATVRASTAAEWSRRIMKAERRAKDEEDPTACLLALCRLSGDRQLDVEEEVRTEVSAYLEKLGVSEADRAPLFRVVEADRKSESAAFGENLPAGLRLG